METSRNGLFSARVGPLFDLALATLTDGYSLVIRYDDLGAVTALIRQPPTK